MITPHTTPPLLALLGSTWARRQIRFALHSGNALRIIGPVVYASSWRELRDLTKRHPGSPAVVDPYFGGTSNPFSGKRDYARADWSSVPLICYAQFGTHQQREVEQAGIGFAARVRPGGSEILPVIDTAILRSIDAQRPARLLKRIDASAHKNTTTLFARALDHAIKPCSVVGLAASLHLTVRTLQRRSTALAIPSPKSLISLVRVFTVERLSEWSRQPSGAVAVALGFSDRSNYRRLVRRVFGAPPGRIRQQGGAKYIEDVIVRELDNSCGRTKAEPFGWARGWKAVGEPAAVPS